jgi:hypothetical protein
MRNKYRIISGNLKGIVILGDLEVEGENVKNSC